MFSTAALRTEENKNCNADWAKTKQAPYTTVFPKGLLKNSSDKFGVVIPLRTWSRSFPTNRGRYTAIKEDNNEERIPKRINGVSGVMIRCDRS